MPKNLTDYEALLQTSPSTLIPFPSGLARPDQTRDWANSLASVVAQHGLTHVANAKLQHSGVVKTVLVPTKDMRADMLTKSLDDETFARHRDTIMNTGALVSRSRLYGIPGDDHSGSGGV